MGRFHEEVTAVLAAVAIAVPARGAAQSGVASGAFVVTLGTDTVAVERYARTATTLTGDMIVRKPGMNSRIRASSPAASRNLRCT